MNRPLWRHPIFILACGTLVLMISFGVRQSFGIFMEPISAGLGWGRQTFSFALALQSLIIGLAVPFAGGVADRWGGGRVIVVGGLLYVLGLLLMSQARDPATMILSASFLIGLGVSATGFPIIFAVISRAVSERRRSLFLGIATAGGTGGQLVLVPGSEVLIGAYGWVSSIIILAAIAALIVVLSAGLVERRAPGAGDGPAQTIGAALREARGHRSYVLLTLGFFVCGFQVQFIAIHLPAYLTDSGLTAAVGAAAIALIGLFNMAGTAISGWLGGRYRKSKLLACIYVLRSLVILGFISAPISEMGVYVFAAAMGMLWLSTVPLTSGLVAQMLGTRYMAMLYGIVFLSHQIGSFAGVMLGGTAYDLTGSYDLFWWSAIAFGLVAALLHWPIDDRPIARPAEA